MQDSGSLVTVVGQTLAIYLFLVACLRLVGRRHMGQATIVEYLIVALLGSAVETALYAGSTSLRAGLASAATLLAADRCLSLAASRVPALRRRLIGSPIILVRDGKIDVRRLRENWITEADLLAAIRQRGYADLGRIRYAVLEIDGSVGIVPRED